MKKMIFLVCILFVTSVQVKAQWSVTPEVGIALIKKNGFLAKGWITGLKTGVGVGYQFNHNMGLKSGLYYAQRGFSMDGIIDPTGEYHAANSEIELKRHFLQVPFMFNYSCPLSNNVVLNLAAGPYIAFSVKDQWNERAFLETHLNENMGSRTFDWGVSASAGLEINKKLVISLNYDLSLGEEAKNDGLNANYHTASLSVGYKFSFK